MLGLGRDDGDFANVMEPCLKLFRDAVYGLSGRVLMDLRSVRCRPSLITGSVMVVIVDIGCRNKIVMS